MRSTNCPPAKQPFLRKNAESSIDEGRLTYRRFYTVMLTLCGLFFYVRMCCKLRKINIKKYFITFDVISQFGKTYNLDPKK